MLRSAYRRWETNAGELPFGWTVLALFTGGLAYQALTAALGIDIDLGSLRIGPVLAGLGVAVGCFTASYAIVLRVARAFSRPSTGEPKES